MNTDEAPPRRRTLGDVDPAEDDLLVLGSQAGDPAAFAQLYGWYASRLVRYCRTQLVRPDEAEDAAQESFVRAWRSLEALAGDRRFYPWLRVIAHNVCVDWNRQRRAEVYGDAELDRLSPRIASGDEEVIAAIDAAFAVEALGRLSPRHREVLKQREQQNWSYQQIADEKGVAVSTIETLLFRARRALRKEFLALTGGDGAAALFIIRLRGWLTRSVGRTSAVATTSEAPAVAVRVATVAACAIASALTVAIAVSPRAHQDPPRTKILQSSPRSPMLALVANEFSPVLGTTLPLLGVQHRNGTTPATTKPATAIGESHDTGASSSRDAASPPPLTTVGSALPRNAEATATSGANHVLASATSTVRSTGSEISGIVPTAEQELTQVNRTAGKLVNSLAATTSRFQHSAKLPGLDRVVSNAPTNTSLPSPAAPPVAQGTGNASGSLSDPLATALTSTDTTTSPAPVAASNASSCTVTGVLTGTAAPVTKCSLAP